MSHVPLLTRATMVLIGCKTEEMGLEPSSKEEENGGGLFLGPPTRQTKNTQVKVIILLEEAMATLQRSAVSFRRQGSSGSVWEDKFSSGNMHNMMQKQGNADHKELRPCQSVVRPSCSTMAPSICPRSLSTPAGKPASHKAFGFGRQLVFEYTGLGTSSQGLYVKRGMIRQGMITWKIERN
ncbi:unnamed protein product, partial [Vitis vinifera]